MHSFNMLRLTIVICIYSMLKDVVIDGNEHQHPNLNGLISKFPISEKIAIGREGGIGSDVGLDGTGVNEGDIERSGILRDIATFAVDKVLQMLKGNSTTVGREGGIGSDVGLDGTGSDVEDIGRKGKKGKLFKKVFIHVLKTVAEQIASHMNPDDPEESDN